MRALGLVGRGELTDTRIADPGGDVCGLLVVPEVPKLRCVQRERNVRRTGHVAPVLTGCARDVDRALFGQSWITLGVQRVVRALHAEAVDHVLLAAKWSGEEIQHTQHLLDPLRRAVLDQSKPEAAS